MNRIIVLVFMALCIQFKALSKDLILGENTQISLLTCSPGADLYSLFGHSAIRVFDPDQNFDAVFNYGSFTFNEDFYFNFTMGRLNYKLSVGSMESFVRSYHHEGRGITEQVLLLSHAQKTALTDFLVWNALPENKYYLYDFFYDNCSSRIRDVLDSALHSDDLVFPDLTHPTNPSFRNLTDPYLVYHPWGDFGIDLGLGLPADKVMTSTEYMFLPNELMKAFGGATLNGQPLVQETKELLPAPVWQYKLSLSDPIPLMWIIAGCFLLLTAIGIRYGKAMIWLDALYLFTVGAVGALTFFLWFITDHTATAQNMNLLWAWPTHWIALLMIWSKPIRTHYFKWLGVFLVFVVISFPFLPQDLHYAVIPLMVAGIGRSFYHWKLIPQA